MLNWIIDFSLRHRLLVIVGAFWSWRRWAALSLRNLDIDAFPDTTPVQVQINTVAPSLGPEEVEQQITFPIEQAIGGLAGAGEHADVSKFGFSQVVVTFEDGTDIYFARQLVNERLATVELSRRDRAAEDGAGRHRAGRSVPLRRRPAAGDDVTELRTIHDWVIKPKLRTVPGVGRNQQLGRLRKTVPGAHRSEPADQVRPDLRRSRARRLKRTTATWAAATFAKARGRCSCRVSAARRTSSRSRQSSITAKDGVPIRVRDVADVAIGSEIRRGAVTADGKGEVVLGLGFMLMGENTHEVTWAMKERLEEIKATLPPNVEVETVYDRTELVDHVIDTVKNNLFEGGLLVIAVLFAFLGNLRAALIVALAIPLSMLFAFSGMLRFGIAASLLSLGAIDFGMIVDSSVVMVENCVRHIAHGDNRRRR